MRFIVFKHLEAKNFLSFGDTIVEVGLRPGVNAIIGTNLDKEDSKNGAGKSSITEMLYYALYGNTLREISKDFIQNSLTKKRCEVNLEFEITSNSSKDLYRIERLLNPTKCTLLKNGVDITRSTLAKTNELIQNIIHTSPAVFKNSVIMSANNAVPFMALSKTDKRKFIESVLGLEVFTQMLLKVRDEYNNSKREYEISYTKYDTLNSELTFNSSQLANYEDAKQQRLNQLEEKKQSLAEDIKKYAASIEQEDTEFGNHVEESTQHLRDKLNKCIEKQKQLNSYVVKTEAEIALERKQKVKLEATKDTCPTCNRDYSDEHITHVQQLIKSHEQIIHEKEELLNKVREGLVKLSIEIENIEDKQKYYKELKQKADLLKRKNEETQMHINFCKRNLQDVEKEIQICSIQHNNDLKGKVLTLESSVKEHKEKADKLNNDLNVLESTKFVLSEEGIKSFLVKKILTILNSRLAFYLNKLEANCLCKFNEFFDEEIIDENSQIKSYFNFSGGERKRIDLACIFAFADIRRLQGDVNFNTVFYDELLDSSLDDKGVLLTLRVLRERFNEYQESCYIITHRGMEVTTKAEHTIHVIKRNGISSIKA